MNCSYTKTKHTVTGYESHDIGMTKRITETIIIFIGSNRWQNICDQIDGSTGIATEDSNANIQFGAFALIDRIEKADQETRNARIWKEKENIETRDEREILTCKNRRIWFCLRKSWLRESGLNFTGKNGKWKENFEKA